MRGNIKTFLIMFAIFIFISSTSFKEVTAKESEVSSSYKEEASSAIQENNIGTVTVNSDEKTYFNECLEDPLWKYNEINNCHIELTDEDKKYLFMILGELDYVNGMPSSDEIKLAIAYNFIYEHEFMYHMFNDGTLDGKCHIPIDKLNELLLNTINTKIDDYSKFTNLFNNENNTNKDVVVFSGANRGDDQPVVKINNITVDSQDSSTVIIEGQVAHVTEFKAQKIDSFKAVAKINKGSQYGMFIVTKFEIQEENTATSTSVNNQNMSYTINENSNSKTFSTGDILNVNHIIIIVLSLAVITGYRKKLI